MGQPERSASSTRRRPSTPTKPPSVGRPPRRATRNSLSQRLSRLVRSADSPGAPTLRAGPLGIASGLMTSQLHAHAHTGEPEHCKNQTIAEAPSSEGWHPTERNEKYG